MQTKTSAEMIKLSWKFTTPEDSSTRLPRETGCTGWPRCVGSCVMEALWRLGETRPTAGSTWSNTREAGPACTWQLEVREVHCPCAGGIDELVVGDGVSGCSSQRLGLGINFGNLQEACRLSTILITCRRNADWPPLRAQQQA